MYLGLQAVIVKSYARIHRANLLNFGVLPLLFKSEQDYDRIEQGDMLEVRDAIKAVEGTQLFTVVNQTKGYTFEVKSDLNEREKELVLMGGLLPYTRGK